MIRVRITRSSSQSADAASTIEVEVRSVLAHIVVEPGPDLPDRQLARVVDAFRGVATEAIAAVGGMERRNVFNTVFLTVPVVPLQQGKHFRSFQVHGG